MNDDVEMRYIGKVWMERQRNERNRVDVVFNFSMKSVTVIK